MSPEGTQRRLTLVRSLLHKLLVSALFLTSAQHLGAATFNVLSTADQSGDLNPGDGVCEGQAGAFILCTLRAAVEEANALAGLDTIEIGPGTFTLTNAAGQLTLTDDVLIEGSGPRATVLRPVDHHRVLQVESDVVAIISDLQITGARLTTTTPGGGWGGGIRSLGNLTLNRVWIHDNQALGCGGLGLRGTANIGNSLLTANRAVHPDNPVTEYNAGALCLSPSTGAVSINNTTFHGNSATGHGGAIHGTPGPTGNLTIKTSTFVDNRSGRVESSEIRMLSGSIHMDLNVIVGTCDLHEGVPKTSDGGNHQSPGNGCIFGGPGNLGNLDRSVLDLGNLDDYGGPLPTILIGSNSLAFDPPGNNVATCFPEDARGLPRVGLCDAGAVERQNDDPETLPIFLDHFESGDTLAWSSALP